MGSNSSKFEDFMKKSFSLSDYEVIDKIFNRLYGGDIQIIQNKINSNDKKIIKEYHYFESNSIENEITHLEKLIKINNSCNYLLKIDGYTHVDDGIFCGKLQKIYLIFEYFEITLMDELNHLQNEIKVFTEKSLKRLIQSIVEALYHLKQNNIYYECLQINSIFITQSSTYKILLPMFFNVNSNYLEFLHSYNKEDFFLSPEALNGIKEKSIFMNFDRYKSDIFILGCIILQLQGKLTSGSLINLQSLDMNMNLITKSLDIIKKNYSESFSNLIKLMVEEKPEKRIDLQEIIKRTTNDKQIFSKEMTYNMIASKQGKDKISLTHNKINHILSSTELNCFNDENLKNFDESKKMITNSQLNVSIKSENLIENKSNYYAYDPISEPKKYELVEEVFKDGSIYTDGGLYEGDWKFGKMDGYGVLYYGDHSIAYEGEWKADKFEGRGILHNDKTSIVYDEKFYDLKDLDNLNNFWIKYEGNFVEDKKDGSGILYFPNGDKISGNFCKDKLLGENCILYRKNGEILKGEWIYNKLIKLS